MKKFFLFAAALVAAMGMNAKVITFTGVIDKTSAETAKSSFEAAFDVKNISVSGLANSKGDAYYADVVQKDATTDWEVTTMALKADDQVYFTFKDNSKADKEVMKAWADYMQPAGKAVCLVITGLKSGDKVRINLKEALKKDVMIEGADKTLDNFADVAVELTAKASEIRVYSKDAGEGSDAKDAKWKLQSVEVPDAQGINEVNAEVKAVKTFENGQLVIIKNGVRYNALGAQF